MSMSFDTARPPCASWVQLSRDRAEANGKREAYVFLADGEEQENRLTYAELDRQARAVAVLLRRASVAPGDRALLLYPPGLEFIAGLFGCWYAGVVAVPTYPPRMAHGAANGTMLQAIAADAQPAILLTASRLRATVDTARASLPAVRNLPIAATDGDDVGALADDWLEPRVQPETLACLQYTSGSTAAPKGVMLTHANLLHNSAIIQQCFGHTTASRGVIWLPPYHDMGLIGGILQPMYAGFPVTLMPPTAFLQRPLRWLEAITRYRATTSGGPNFAYDLCVQRIAPEQRQTLDLSSWDLAFNGAEPVLGQTLDRFAASFAPHGFRRQAFYPCYGLAESTLLVTGGAKGSAPVLSSKTDHGSALVACGRTHSDSDVVIVDPETRAPRPAGQVGEIWVSGGSVALGYWQKPAETAETFTAQLTDGRGPFLRTGDLGFMNGTELFITGRLKDLIIIRGVNHYPHDIEQTALASHPALRSGGGAAFSINGDGPERLVVLHEVERAQRDADADEIIGNIRQAIAERHELQVHAIALLKPGRILKTSSGKVRRLACREAFLNRAFEMLAEWTQPAEMTQAATTEDSAVSPSPQAMTADQIEDLVTARLAAALNMQPQEIDPADAFARHGLDSAGAAQLAATLEELLDRELPPTLFYDYPSPRELAQFLSQSSPNPHATANPQERR